MSENQEVCQARRHSIFKALYCMSRNGYLGHWLDRWCGHQWRATNTLRFENDIVFIAETTDHENKIYAVERCSTRLNSCGKQSKSQESTQWIRAEIWMLKSLKELGQLERHDHRRMTEISKISKRGRKMHVCARACVCTFMYVHICIHTYMVSEKEQCGTKL